MWEIILIKYTLGNYIDLFVSKERIHTKRDKHKQRPYHSIKDSVEAPIFRKQIWINAMKYKFLFKLSTLLYRLIITGWQKMTQ